MRAGVRWGSGAGKISAVALVGLVGVTAVNPGGGVASGQSRPGPIDYRVTDIRIVPLGGLSARDVEPVRRIVAREFPGILVIPGDPEGLPGNAFDAARFQFNADVVVMWLAARVPSRSVRFVGVTTGDLFSPGLNFVFSTALSKGTAAVMSLARLRDPDEQLSEERFRKIVLRALGFTFGFESSPDPSCVMSYSNSLADLDRKGTAWCGNEPETLRRIQGQQPVMPHK